MAPLLSALNRRLRVLDLGGTPQFWLNQPHPWHQQWEITLLNLSVHSDSRFLSHSLDVTQVTAGFLGSFDLIFSNSLIEHLGTWKNKRNLADAIVASGRPYFIQTPSFWFPIEPHCLIPLFQFLPRPMQVALLDQHSRIFRTAGNHDQAQAAVDEIALLTRAQLRNLFPKAQILSERVLGLPKSYVAHRLESLGGKSDGKTRHP